ncbi:MAG: hypothetical protein P1P87_12915, partial [Trueperaceae bacterium]|nr:hypothetical protein [Trueperaceae bacterium]
MQAREVGERGAARDRQVGALGDRQHPFEGRGGAPWGGAIASDQALQVDRARQRAVVADGLEAGGRPREPGVGVLVAREVEEGVAAHARSVRSGARRAGVERVRHRVEPRQRGLGAAQQPVGPSLRDGQRSPQRARVRRWHAHQPHLGAGEPRVRVAPS